MLIGQLNLGWPMALWNHVRVKRFTITTVLFLFPVLLFIKLAAMAWRWCHWACIHGLCCLGYIRPWFLDSSLFTWLFLSSRHQAPVPLVLSCQSIIRLFEAMYPSQYQSSRKPPIPILKKRCEWKHFGMAPISNHDHSNAYFFLPSLELAAAKSAIPVALSQIVKLSESHLPTN